MACDISRIVLGESLDDGVDSRRHSLGLEVEVVLDGRVALWHAGLLERLERQSKNIELHSGIWEKGVCHIWEEWVPKNSSRAPETTP